MKMRTMISAAFCLVLALSACKKESTTAPTVNPPEAITVISSSAVPSAVTASFSSSFAGATEVEWHRSSNQFEVEFNHQSQRHHAGYDDSGHQHSHSVSCSSGAVPAAVLDAFRARNPNDNVYEWKLKTDGNWQAHFNRNGVKWETLFTPAGVFVKEEHD